jgi:hypothetical protein
MYKWYEGKRTDSEQRDGKTTEIFLLGIESFVYRREIESAVRVLNDMLRNVGWKRGAMRGRIGGVGIQMSVGEGRQW